MKLRFTRSETDPNHCSKVVDDRPLVPAPSKDNLFLTGADPLICKSKREMDSGCGTVNYKPMTTSRILTFGSYMVVMSDQIWEMPLSFINSFALMFLVTSIRIYVLQLAWCQESSEISLGHNLSWIEIHCQKCEAAWLFECWLDRQCGGSQEHLWVLVLFILCFDIMDEQEAEVGCYKHYRDRIHSYEYDLVWSSLVVEAFQWVVCTHDGYHCDLLCQPRGIQLLRNPVFYDCSSK